MRITRKEILRAIRTEKLKGGEFIEERPLYDVFGFYGYKVDDTCKVCAVGAVLRQKGIDNKEIPQTGYNVSDLNDISREGDLEGALEAKDYMAALSIKFERLYRSYRGGKRTKEKLARFVKANFPKEIRVKGV